MRAAVMPLPGQARGLQHPRHRAIPHTPDEPNHQHAERLKAWLREARGQQGQQTGQRTGNLIHGGDLPVEGPRERSLRPVADGLYAHRIRGRRQPSLPPAQAPKRRSPAPPTAAITRSPATTKTPKLEEITRRGETKVYFSSLTCCYTSRA